METHRIFNCFKVETPLMKKIIVIFLLMVCIKTFSQNIEPIQPDRPDQTESPIIVPVKYFQAENGFAYFYNDENNKAYTYPSTLFKYGLTKFLDLRLIA